MIIQYNWIRLTIKTAQGYLARKLFKCVCLSFSLFIITRKNLKSEYHILFKLNNLVVAIGKKVAPGDHESSLKILIFKLSIARYPCAIKTSKLNFSRFLIFCSKQSYVILIFMIKNVKESRHMNLPDLEASLQPYINV